MCVYFWHGEWLCCFAVFSGSALASPQATSASAIRLKEEPLFTRIIIRKLSASWQRTGPSGFDPSSLTQALLSSVCLSDVLQTSTVWQDKAFYRQQNRHSALESVKGCRCAALLRGLFVSEWEKVSVHVHRKKWNFQYYIQIFFLALRYQKLASSSQTTWSGSWC